MTSESPSNAWRYAVRVALIALLSFVIAGAVGQALLGMMQEGVQPSVAMDRPLLGLSAVLWSLGIAAQGPRWAAILPAPRPSVAQSALAVLGTNTLTVTVPGPSGEAMLAAYSDRVLGIPWPTAASATLISRLLGLGLLGILLLVGVVALPGLQQWQTAAGVALGLSGSSLAAYLLISKQARPLVVALSEWLTQRVSTHVAAKLRAALHDALAPGAGADWGRAVTWSLLSTLLMAAGGYTSACAAHLAPAPLVYLWMHVATAVAGVVAFVIPAGLGAIDALWVGLFVATGHAAAEGVLAAVAWRQMQALALLVTLGPLLWISKKAARAT